MFYKTRHESHEIASVYGVSTAAMKKWTTLRAKVQNSVVVHLGKRPLEWLGLAQRMASWLGDRGDALLLVTEFGIWPGSEDMNLYYRLRASYGDARELREAPGHYFLPHERVDLVTFLSLILRFGWGGYLMTGAICAYVSHDGWMRIRYRPEPDVEPSKARVLKDLGGLSLKYDLE